MNSDSLLKELPPHIKDCGIYFCLGLAITPENTWMAGYFPLEQWMFEADTPVEALLKVKERNDAYQAVKKLVS